MQTMRFWPLVVALCLATACSNTTASSDQNAGSTLAPLGTSTTTMRPSVPAGWVEYTDPSGVQFAHPSDWTVEPGAAGPVIVSIDPANGVPFRRNVNGMLQVLHDITLDDYVELSQTQFEKVGAEVVSEGKTTLGGTPAYEWRYRATMGSQDLEFWAVVTMREGRPWLFTYTSDPARFDEESDNVATLFESIRLPE